MRSSVLLPSHFLNQGVTEADGYLYRIMGRRVLPIMSVAQASLVHLSFQESLQLLKLRQRLVYDFHSAVQYMVALDVRLFRLCLPLPRALGLSVGYPYPLGWGDLTRAV